MTGGSSVGQGFATAMAQICADTLGVDYRRVRVVLGQTDRIQYGIGAHASRASVMTGGATHAAALKVRAKALEMAGALLQAAPDDLDIIDGMVVHRDRPGGPSISLGDDRPASGAGLADCSASATPGSRPRAGSAPST